MNENCGTCKYRKKLVKFDYSGMGCEHTNYEGFACLAFVSEDVVVHHVGEEAEEGMCEVYTPR